MLTRRSTHIRLAVCITLGAVTTWIVAAAFAVWAPAPELLYRATISQPTVDGDIGALVIREHAWARGRETRRVIVVPPTSSALDRLYPVYAEMVRTSQSRAPASGAWGEAESATDEALAGQGVAVVDEGFGWPRLAFWYAVQIPWDGEGYARAGGLNLSPLTGREAHTFRSIPYFPIWPGFLLNTGFYGVLWALPFFGLPLLKQSRRQRKGRCPNCAYDLKRDFQSGCPECGWKRDAAP